MSVRIDPGARDYIRTASNDLEQVSDAQSQEVYRRLAVELGSCWWDRTFGSRLHELRRMGLRQGWEREVEDMVHEALQPMVARGELSQVQVEHDRPDPNRVHIGISALGAGRKPLTFDHWVGL